MVPVLLALISGMTPARGESPVCTETIEKLQANQKAKDGEISRLLTEMTFQVSALSRDAISSTVTGPSIPGVNGISSNMEDFAHDFVLTNFFSRDDATGSFSLDIALPFLGGQDEGKPNGKLKITLPGEPAPYEPLLQSFSDDQRDAISEKLSAGLSRADDINVTFVYSIESRILELGRDYSLYATDVEEKVEAALKSTASAALRDGKILSRIQRSGFIGPGVRPAEEECRKIIADAIRPELVDAIHLIPNLAGTLVSNQPQFTVEIGVSDRSEAAGPDTYTAKVNYEMGFANWSRFKPSADDDLLQLLRDNRKEIEAAHRLGFSLEYEQVEAFDFTFIDSTLAPEGLEFFQGSSRKLKGSLDYSRYLGRIVRADARRTRFQLSLAYEGSNNKQVNDRSVATATFTIPIGKDASLPIGLRYANKPEFLGAVNEELTAHIGLTWNTDHLFGN